MVGKMKNALAIIMIVLFNALLEILNNKTFSNTINNNNMTFDFLTINGGKYITASGELKVLVVFAKFKDDSSYHPY